MPKFFSILRKRKDFLAASKSGLYSAMPNLIVQAKPRIVKDDENLSTSNSEIIENVRVGFTATKKIGGAVARNRAKRRMRAIVFHILPQFLMHPYWVAFDLVIIAKKSIITSPFSAIIEDLKNALHRLGFKEAC